MTLLPSRIISFMEAAPLISSVKIFYHTFPLPATASHWLRLYFYAMIRKSVTHGGKEALSEVNTIFLRGGKISEDQHIVEPYWLRDEAAIAATSEKYGSRLRGLALGITKHSATAEECENDTYLRAWNAIPPSRPVQYLFAFLARITDRKSTRLNSS